jgi:hypothetical protein
VSASAIGCRLSAGGGDAIASTVWLDERVVASRQAALRAPGA